MMVYGAGDKEAGITWGEGGVAGETTNAWNMSRKTVCSNKVIVGDDAKAFQWLKFDSTANWENRVVFYKKLKVQLP